MGTERAKGILDIVTRGEGKLDNLDAKMDKVTSNTRWTSVATGVTAFANALPMVTQAFNSVVDSASEFFELAAAEQSNIRSLSSAVESVGIAYEFVAEAQERQFAVNQDLTRFGDTDQRATLTELIRLTRSYEDSQRHLNLALDVQVGAKLGSVEASKLVAFALAGEISAMGRVIPAARELGRQYVHLTGTAEGAEIAVKLLADTFGGAATDEAGTAEQAVTSLTNAWGDLREELGEGLVSAGTTELLAGVTESVKEMTGEVDQARFAWGGWFGSLRASSPIINFLGTIGDGYRETGREARAATEEMRALQDLADSFAPQGPGIYNPKPQEPARPALADFAEVDDDILNISRQFDVYGQSIERVIGIRGELHKLEFNSSKFITQATRDRASEELAAAQMLQTNWGEYFALNIASSIDLANLSKLTLDDFVANTLNAISQTAKIRAVESLALGFSLLAPSLLGPAGPAAAFKAAALWGSIAVGSSLIAGGIASTSSSSSGDYGSRYESGGGYEARIRRSTGGGNSYGGSSYGGGNIYVSVNNNGGTVYGEQGLRQMTEKQIVPQIAQAARVGKLRGLAA